MLQELDPGARGRRRQFDVSANGLSPTSAAPGVHRLSRSRLGRSRRAQKPLHDDRIPRQARLSRNDRRLLADRLRDDDSGRLGVRHRTRGLDPADVRGVDREGTDLVARRPVADPRLGPGRPGQPYRKRADGSGELSPSPTPKSAQWASSWWRNGGKSQRYTESGAAIRHGLPGSSRPGKPR